MQRCLVTRALVRRKILAVAVTAAVAGSFLAQRPASADPFTAGAIIFGVGWALKGISMLIDAADSGADPTYELARQNREYLRHVWQSQQLVNERILEALDELPERLRRDMKRALDDQRKLDLLAASDLMLEKIALVAQGHQIAVPLESSLHDFSLARSRLLRVPDEIAILPLSAMLRVEILGLAVLEASDAEIRAVTEAYLDRFRLALDPDRAGSIAAHTRRLQSSIEGLITASWTAAEAKLRHFYHNGPCVDRLPRSGFVCVARSDVAFPFLAEREDELRPRMQDYVLYQAIADAAAAQISSYGSPSPGVSASAVYSRLADQTKERLHAWVGSLEYLRRIAVAHNAIRPRPHRPVRPVRHITPPYEGCNDTGQCP